MRYYLSFCFLFTTLQAFSQSTAEEYGELVYKMIIRGDQNLNDQFIDLNQYAAYIDNLETLEEFEKDNMKYSAQENYSDIRYDFDKECNRILDLYAEDANYGTTFTFEACEFEANKTFPDLGMMTCYYIADIPDEEEPVRDAIRFECIKTANGWRILDGFFDETDANR